MLRIRLGPILLHKIAQSEFGRIERAVEVHVDHTKVRLTKVIVSAFDLEYVVLRTYPGVRDDVVDLPARRERGGLLEELNLVLPFRDVALNEFDPFNRVSVSSRYGESGRVKSPLPLKFGFELFPHLDISISDDDGDAGSPC